jgi:CPA2 family monovalent cation:H+ antiporter-2
MQTFLAQALVYLAAAVICVPIAKKLGMGSVLGYLLAGIVIGPFVFGFVGEEGRDIMHFAEFGVVMMLFLVGLELEPATFWRMRRMVLGMGGTQVLLTSLVIGSVAFAFGLSWQASIAIGLTLSMSSTAIALQSLKEKGLLNTSAGQSSFSVLLFQDIAVIPILALLPLLALSPLATADTHGMLGDLSGWAQTGVVVAAVAVVILAGRYVVVPLLRVIARTHLRELFTASALLLVVAIALLMEMVGLSPALGTFLAGVVLANSEFKHELESDLDPFKGLLLGLFFMAVGASINFDLIAGAPITVVGITLGVMTLKMLVLLGIGFRAKLGFDQRMLFTVGLGQVGEFAFVLLSFIGGLALLEPRMLDMLMAVTALSMTFTPLLMLVNEKLLLPNLGTRESDQRAADTIDEKHRVIIAGFSHFGSTIGRFLRANGVEATILDNDSDTVDLLRRMGFKVFYGDATRADLLEAAGAADAHILICAVDGMRAPEVVATAQKHFPHLQLWVRTKNRFTLYQLQERDVQHAYRETFDTAVRMGADVLKSLGFRAYTAQRAAQNFMRYDEEALVELGLKYRDRHAYITSVREQIALQEELLRNDLQHDPTAGDHAWDSEEMRGALKRPSE